MAGCMLPMFDINSVRLVIHCFNAAEGSQGC